MKARLGIIVALLVLIVVLSLNLFIGKNDTPTIANSFESCVAAGNLVMESYPRQCRDTSGRTYTEEMVQDREVQRTIEPSMTPAEARTNAETSSCIKEGAIGQLELYDPNTGMWWFTLDVTDKKGCNPACVIDDQTDASEIDYRCDNRNSR